MSIRDHRLAPFCYQTIAARAAIRTHFGHVEPAEPARGCDRRLGCVAGCRFAERSTASAVYDALTEIANELRGRDAGFSAPRRRVADYAGVTTRTLDKYAREFEVIGVLRVDRRRVGGLNLPNVWHLVEPDGGETSGGSASDFSTPGETSDTTLAKPATPPSGNQRHQGGETSDTPFQEEQQEPPLRGGKKQRVDHDALPDDFPEHLVPALDQVVPILERVAGAKGAIAVARAGVARTIASRPLKPHARAAADFETYWLHGKGSARRMKDVVASYRNWLDNENDIAPAVAGASAPRSRRLAHPSIDDTELARLEAKFGGHLQ